MFKQLRRYYRTYKEFFRTFVKTKLVYKTDFILGSINETISFLSSIALIGLIFTQVEAINGWGFYELIFLYGFGRLVLSIHNFFLFAPFVLGDRYIINGNFDRFLVRPLNPLFQVYSTYIQMHGFANILAASGIIIYTSLQISGNIFTVQNLLYLVPAILSGVLVTASIFLTFATTGFWTGRTMALFRLFWDFGEFRKYPLEIYPVALKTFFVTIMPIMFASYFPASFLLGKDVYPKLQLITLIAGPIFYMLAYRFWLHGLKNYTSTGS